MDNFPDYDDKKHSLPKWLLRFDRALSLHDVQEDRDKISWLLVSLGTAGDSLIDAVRPPDEPYDDFRAFVLQQLLPPSDPAALNPYGSGGTYAVPSKTVGS